MEVYDYSKPNFIDYAESESIYLDVDFENSLVNVTGDLSFTNNGVTLVPNGVGEPQITLGSIIKPIPKKIPFPLMDDVTWTPGKDIRDFGYFVGDIKFSDNIHSDSNGYCDYPLGSIVNNDSGILNIIIINKNNYYTNLNIMVMDVTVYNNNDVVYKSTHNVINNTITMSELIVNWTKVDLVVKEINKPNHLIIWFALSKQNTVVGSELLFNDEIKSASFDFGDIGEVYQEYYNVIEKTLILEITDTKGIFDPYSPNYNLDILKGIEKSSIKVSLLTDEFPTVIHPEQNLGTWYFSSYTYNYNDNLWTLNYVDSMRELGTTNKIKPLVGQTISTSEINKVSSYNYSNFFNWLYGSQLGTYVAYNKPTDYIIPYMPFINIRRGILNPHYDEKNGQHMDNYPYKDTDYMYRVENNPMLLLTSTYGKYGAISQIMLNDTLRLTSFDPYSKGRYNTSIRVPYESLLSLEVSMLGDTPYDGVSVSGVPVLYNNPNQWSRTFKPFSGYISKKFGSLNKDVLIISNPKNGNHEYTDGSHTPDEVNELLICKWTSNGVGMNQGTEFFNQVSYKDYDDSNSELPLKSIDNEQLPMFITYIKKPSSIYALYPKSQSGVTMSDDSVWGYVTNIHLPSTLDGDRERWQFNNSLSEPRTQVWDYVSDYIGIDKSKPENNQTVPLTVSYANEPNIDIFKNSTHKITTEMWYSPDLHVGDTFTIVHETAEHIYMVTSKKLEWTGSMQMVIEATHLKTV